VGLCKGFANDGHGVDVCWRLSKGEDFRARVGVAVASVVAAVRVGGGGIAAVDWNAVVVDVCGCWSRVCRSSWDQVKSYLSSVVDSCQTSKRHRCRFLCGDAL
jgi:hypothetical protein